jgi:uncharacterized protein
MDLIEYMRFLHHFLFIKTKTYTLNEKSIFTIDYKKLKKEKIKLLIFDVDDTLTWHRGALEEKTIKLLKKLSKDFNIAILSNCEDRRRKEIATMLFGINLFISPHSDKPGKEGFINSMKHFSILPENTAMIGDRLGTDIWGAYITKIKERILVKGY